jgi:hypothetical protein
MPTAKGSLRDLVEKYYASRDTFLALVPSTQSVKGNLLDAVCLETVSNADPRLIGSLPYAIIRAEAIKNLRDRRPTIEGANGRLKALRGLFDWAVKDKLMMRNPAKDVPYLKSKSTGFHTWTVEEARQYEERHPIGPKRARRSACCSSPASDDQTSRILGGSTSASPGTCQQSCALFIPAAGFPSGSTRAGTAVRSI